MPQLRDPKFELIMKKFMFIVCILFITNPGANAQDSLTVNNPIVLQLQSLDLGQFTGHKVDSLVSLLPCGQTGTQILGSITMKRAGYLVVRYATRTYVLIGVTSFTHMNPNYSPTGNPRQNWNINQFKQEIISFAIAFNGECINGCANRMKIN